MTFFIIGNFGNHSLAALQYLIESDHNQLHYLAVQTGWAAPGWQTRVEKVCDYMTGKGAQVHMLKPLMDFSDMVRDRQQFPSQSFQWCTSFLKGLTIIEHLQKADPFGEATVVSGKRRMDSPRFSSLPEYIEHHEKYEDRRVWYPLFLHQNKPFESLIERTGMPFLKHPGRECYPCIHSSEQTIAQLPVSVKKNIAQLETEINASLYAKPIMTYKDNKQRPPSIDKPFDRGCGTTWCCGE